MAHPGDTIIIWKLDRLARSLEHLDQLRKDLESRGIDFVSITEGFDTTEPAGKLSFNIVAAITEFERGLIRERTRAVLDAARSRGKIGGRKLALNIVKRDAVVRLFKDSKDLAAISRAVGVTFPDTFRFSFTL